MADYKKNNNKNPHSNNWHNNNGQNHRGNGQRNGYGNGKQYNRGAQPSNMFTDKIKSPYNFVPLNKQVYIPNWWNKVSHDIPFEDGIDGWIEVTWQNISPLFIRDASVDNGEFSMHINENGSRRYFIPGSSLKGMLRSVISILSFGKMEQYNNQYFGHRDFDTKLPKGREYAKLMKDVKFGWLEKHPDETYVLYPCKGKYEKIPFSEVKEAFGDKYKPSANVWEINERLRDGNELFPYFTFDDGTECRLFCTGRMNGKNHELLIPADTKAGITLDDKIVESFLTVYAPTPGFENFVSYLDKGERIPVSFIDKIDKGKTTIIAMGMGRMFRYPYKQDINTLVKNEQYIPQKGYDLCETMFGRVDDKDPNGNLKGRVQIGNAMMEGIIGDNELLGELKGVLGGPKASFYPLYLKQDANGVYRTYEDAKGIAGRKRYRIHKGDTVVELPQGNGNDNVMTRFRPIPRNNRFKMRINIHNLKPMELGALLLAIKLKDGAYHNIGMAKAYGYGKLISKNIVLHLRGEEKRDVDSFINLFKKEMTTFTNYSEVITSLVGIMSEHTLDDMFVNESGKYRVMSLKEYKEFKKNNNYSKLTEKPNLGILP